VSAVATACDVIHFAPQTEARLRGRADLPREERRFTRHESGDRFAIARGALCAPAHRDAPVVHG